MYHLSWFDYDDYTQHSKILTNGAYHSGQWKLWSEITLDVAKNVITNEILPFFDDGDVFKLETIVEEG